MRTIRHFPRRLLTVTVTVDLRRSTGPGSTLCVRSSSQSMRTFHSSGPPWGVLLSTDEAMRRCAVRADRSSRNVANSPKNCRSTNERNNAALPACRARLASRIIWRIAAASTRDSVRPRCIMTPAPATSRAIQALRDRVGNAGDGTRGNRMPVPNRRILGRPRQCGTGSVGWRSRAPPMVPCTPNALRFRQNPDLEYRQGSYSRHPRSVALPSQRTAVLAGCPTAS